MRMSTFVHEHSESNVLLFHALNLSAISPLPLGVIRRERGMAQLPLDGAIE